MSHPWSRRLNPDQLIALNDWDDLQITFSTYRDDEEIITIYRGLDAAKRFIGFLLLQFMPSEGLDESVETLSDIFNFHSENRNFLEAELDSPLRIPGKLKEVVDRPDMVVPK